MSDERTHEYTPGLHGWITHTELSSDDPEVMLTAHRGREATVSDGNAGKQVVGIDLHLHRSVIGRIDNHGNELGWVRIDTDPKALAAECRKGRSWRTGRDRGDLRLVLGGRRAARRRGSRCTWRTRWG